jgi:hypothetical protein
MAALNRFISRLGEKDLPFFKLLKKAGKCEWPKEAKDAFERLQKYLSTSPRRKQEPLMIYITATNMVVNTAIIVEREEVGLVYKVQ